MNPFKKFASASALTVSLLLMAAGASALCDQTAASQADRDLWGTHGCWQEYFLWQYLAYDLNGSEWTNRGWNDACNVVLEYPKHWNAAYLLTYGLLDNYDQSFHGTIDYRATAEAASSNFHDHIHHTIGEKAGVFGGYGGGVVTTYCPLYSSTHANGNPASRAGDFMHEGWHAWLDKYNWDNALRSESRRQGTNLPHRRLCAAASGNLRQRRVPSDAGAVKLSRRVRARCRQET
jgi:hypothetical protein